MPTTHIPGPRPPVSPFEPYASDSREVVLYDIETLTERQLGVGGLPRFSPDGSLFAWIAFSDPASMMEGSLRVVDLATAEERVIGPARSLRWLDEQHVIVHVRGNEMAIVDVLTGEYGDPGSLNLNPPLLSEVANGLRLEDISPERTNGPAWGNRYRITFLDGTKAPLEFDAYRARLSPDGKVVFAVAPARVTKDAAWGTAIEGNIYLAEPRTLEAAYVATGLLTYGNWPLDISRGHIYWTNDFCRVAGKAGVQIYDRDTKTITELDDSFWAEFTPDGDLAVGEFGAGRILDVDRLEYTVALPWDFNDVFWSADYRYAATGYTGGHGGLCG